MARHFCSASGLVWSTNFRDGHHSALRYRDCMGRRWKPHGKGGWGPWEIGGRFPALPAVLEADSLSLAKSASPSCRFWQKDPKHGYQLIKDMTERSGGMYRASAGTVYPTLQQLEDEGLVQSDTQDGRRTYRLTPEGINELDREKETVERIWKRAERWENWGESTGPESFTFFRPLGTLVKATFKAAKWAAGDPDREKRLTEILEYTKRALEELAIRS